MKTDCDKEIAVLMPSKIENTQGKEYEINSKTYRGGKVIPDLLMIYWINKEIISCKWKHSVQPDFVSNDDCLFQLPGLTI